MKGEKLLAVYLPKEEEDWFLFATSGGNYEVRVGCFKKTEEERNSSLKMDLDFPQEEITRIMTNEYNTYFELSNGGCVMHIESYITGLGDMYFEVRYWDADQFEVEKKEWYDSDPDFKELISSI